MAGLRHRGQSVLHAPDVADAHEEVDRRELARLARMGPFHSAVHLLSLLLAPAALYLALFERSAPAAPFASRALSGLVSAGVCRVVAPPLSQDGGDSAYVRSLRYAVYVSLAAVSVAVVWWVGAVCSPCGTVNLSWQPAAAAAGVGLLGAMLVVARPAALTACGVLPKGEAVSRLDADVKPPSPGSAVLRCFRIVGASVVQPAVDSLFFVAALLPAMKEAGLPQEAALAAVCVLWAVSHSVYPYEAPFRAAFASAVALVGLLPRGESAAAAVFVALVARNAALCLLAARQHLWHLWDQ
eukprot:TRINITY_DN26577_c0_g1_i1.p1 TRINITY_DN26577_c0_g1~~TRINITY_DN26577_c0_g1_i1.p1  ORF type:complete len:298 (+),score=81.16 TRINITY_DN26577_c0_g1_i1:61-954(+)